MKIDWAGWRRGIPIYLMILPGLLYFMTFRYAPMGGLIIAFKEYDVFKGFLESPWVGFEHFIRFFKDPDFIKLLRNTLMLSLLNLVVYFPAPIILALLLHEVRSNVFRKSVQTVVYMPHLLSWVVIVSITALLFNTQSGSLNNMLAGIGMKRIELMTNPSYFRPLFVFQNIWKEAGWSAIVFLAALASVDPSLYEAATVDGATRFQKLWHINLPSIKSTIIILFILRVGHTMDSGFEHVFLLQNMLNISVSDVFDTYSYRTGIGSGQFSYASAVGLFKSIVAVSLIMGTNRLAKFLREEGVY